MMKKFTLIIAAFLLCLTAGAQEALITGYVDSTCPGADGRTVEIYVSGTVDFTDWNLVKQSNGGGFTSNSDISGFGTISDAFVYVTSDETILDNEFGINSGNATIIENGGISDNGDDGYQLTDASGTVIDRFSEDGVDGSGTTWEHEDSYYYRNDNETANAGNFDPANWTFGDLDLLDGEGTCNGGDPFSDFVPFGSFEPSSGGGDDCSPASVPYTEDFESITPPDLPDCTSTENVGNGNDWQTYTIDNSGFDGNVLGYGYSSEPADTWFFTEGVQLTANVTYQISFKYGDYNFEEKLKVSYGTSDNASAMSTELADYTTPGNNTPNTPTINFSVSADGVYYFGFNAHSDSNQNYLYLDNIAVEEAPSCLTPTALSLDDNAETTADISWTAEGGETEWEVRYGEIGFAPDSEGTSENVTVTNITLDGLNSGTSYDVYVRAFCSDADQSDWEGPLTFTTTLEGGYCMPEGTDSSRYIDNFSTTGGSQNITNTGSGFSNGGYGNFTSMTVEQETQETIDFTVDIEGGIAGFRIWADWNQNGEFENNEVAYSSNDYSASHSGFMTVPSDALAGETRMRIVSHWLSTSGDVDPCETGFSYGEFEDYTVSVIGVETCAEPSDITIDLDEITDTSIDISWTENGTASEWEVAYGEIAFDPENEGTTVTVETNPNTTLDGLDPDSTYEVYVRAVCGPDNKSDFVGPEQFTTDLEPCNTPTNIVIDPEQVTNTTADVSWTPGGSESSWNVIYGEAGFDFGNEGESLNIDNGIPEITLTNLEPNTDYDVYVVALCDNTAASDPVGPETFTTGNMSVDNRYFESFTFYPNPVKDQLTLKAGTQIESVSVYNLLGQSVMSETPNQLQTELNTASLQSGVYLMKVNINGSTKTFRVVKN